MVPDFHLFVHALAAAFASTALAFAVLLVFPIIWWRSAAFEGFFFLIFSALIVACAF